MREQFIHQAPEAPIDLPVSPFLPGTKIQYAWDSTSLGLIKTCPKLYYYTMIEGYQSRDENIHLRFGGEFHQALWDYDMAIAEGIPHDIAVHMVIKELMLRTADFHPTPDTKAGKYKSRETLIRTVVNYLDHRKDDVLKTYMLTNGKPAVELSFRFGLEFGPEISVTSAYFTGLNPLNPLEGELVPAKQAQPYLLCGHLDRVVTDPDGNLFVEDAKTTTTTPGAYFFDGFEPSNQMSLYSFAGKIVFDMPIRGVAINAVQILLEHPHNRFQRGFTFRNQDQLEEWMIDLSRWLSIAEWYATNGEWPQNDTACDKFGGCKFRKVCSKAPSVRHIYLNSDFIKLSEAERWNPLKPR